MRKRSFRTKLVVGTFLLLVSLLLPGVSSSITMEEIRELKELGVNQAIIDEIIKKEGIQRETKPTPTKPTPTTQPVKKAPTKTEAEVSRRTKFGVGFQSTFPVWGISGMMDMNEKISLQGILGLLGGLKMCSGKGIYRFRREPYWNTYGYGMIGAWWYSYRELEGWTWKEKTETALGLGGGVGIEYNWQALWGPDLPPIWWNLEVGLGVLKFELGWLGRLDYSGLWLGCGGHYRF